MNPSIATTQTIRIVGGGISGMTAALDAAECCKQVILEVQCDRNFQLMQSSECAYNGPINAFIMGAT